MIDFPHLGREVSREPPVHRYVRIGEDEELSPCSSVPRSKHVVPRIIASIGPYSATVAPIPTKPARPIHNCSWPRVGSGIPGTHSDPQERRCPSPSLSKSSCVDLGSKSQATGEGPSGVSGRGVSESRPARSTGSCWVGLQKRGGIGDGTPSWTTRRGSASSPRPRRVRDRPGTLLATSRRDRHGPGSRLSPSCSRAPRLGCGGRRGELARGRRREAQEAGAHTHATISFIGRSLALLD